MAEETSVVRTTVLIALRDGRDTALATALAGMGLALPKMGHFTEAGGLLLARTAPMQLMAMRPGPDAPLLDELAPLTAADADPCAELIDLSDARSGLRLDGPAARARLACLVPIDLHPARFGPGRCAQTIAAHMSVLVLALAPDVYELQGSRSYAGSLARAVEATRPVRADGATTRA